MTPNPGYSCCTQGCGERCAEGVTCDYLYSLSMGQSILRGMIYLDGGNGYTSSGVIYSAPQGVVRKRVFGYIHQPLHSAQSFLSVKYVLDILLVVERQYH